MTSEEKKLLQAKHRLEEAQARDRVKERKARTRRLIQEGAVLEKVLPEVQAVGLDNLEEYLRRKLQDTIENGWEVSGKPGAFLFFIPKGALTHHPQAGGGMAFGHRALSEGDCGSCGSRWTMPQPGRRCCHRPCSRPCDRVARRHSITAAVCLRKAATGSFAAEMGASLGWGAPIFFL